MLDRELQSVLLYFRESFQKGGTVSACWMAHGLFNHASTGSRGIDE